MPDGLKLGAAMAAVCAVSLALSLGGCRQASPVPPPAIVTQPDVAGSYDAEYARDDGNLVNVTYDLYVDRTFRGVTTVTGADWPQVVQQEDDREVLSRTVVTGTWQLASGNDARAGGTVQLQVTGCDGDACGSAVDVGDTLELSYAVNDDGTVDLDVAPGATDTGTTATREPISSTPPPALTRQIPGVQVAMGTPETIDVSEHIGGATSYDATSSDASHLTVGVSGSVLTLTPVSVTDQSDPVVVTVTASNGAGSIDATFNVDVVPATEPSSELAPTLTSQISEQRVRMGYGKPIDLSGYFAGATSYGAKSSDTSSLTVRVSGSILMLRPRSRTEESDPVVVTVTASNRAGNIDATFDVHVGPTIVVTTQLVFEVTMGTTKTVDLEENDIGRPGLMLPHRYRAKSSDTSHLTVSVTGTELTLTPVSPTPADEPVSVIVTYSEFCCREADFWFDVRVLPA